MYCQTDGSSFLKRKLIVIRYSTFALAVSLLGIWALATTSQAETLNDAVKKMIATNPDIRSSAYNRLARDEEVRQARSGYFPTLDLEAGVGKDYVEQPFDEELNPTQFNLSLRQNVFAGLSTMNEVDRQRARVNSQAYLVRSTAENIALKTAGLYLDVLRNQKVHELAKENLTIHERITDQIQLRSESGVGRRADMDQIQSRLNLARANVVVTEQNLLDSKTNYLAVVGHLPQSLIRPSPPEEYLPASLDQAEQNSIRYHPTLHSANADIAARMAQDKVARSPFMPIVDIEIDQINEDETNYSFDRREDLRLILRLRYNLFNGWKDHARKAETTHLISEAREIRNHTHRQVVESVRLSWMAYKAARNKLTYLDQRVAFATATAKAYSAQWNIGQRTLLDVLDSEAERIDATQQLINTEYEELYAQYRILNSTGQLVHALNLEWPQEALLEEQDQVN